MRAVYKRANSRSRLDRPPCEMDRDGFGNSIGN
jgi:hypothetical protein